MSDLITNLNQIYATKLQIKSVIETDSDTFSEYPSIIQQKIDENTPTGYAYITTNGNHDIASYAYVNVDVQGGVAVLGDLSVSENGVYAASSYAYDGFDTVTVNVPIDWDEVATYGYVLPSGTINIENNGTVDVSSYSSAYVNVSGGGPSLGGYFYNIVLESSMTDNVNGQDFDSSIDIASAGYPAYVINQVWTEPLTIPSLSGPTPVIDYWQSKIYTYTSNGKGDLIASSDKVTNPYYGYVSYTFPSEFNNMIGFYAESFSWVEDPELPEGGDYQSNGEVPMFVNNGTSVDNFILSPASLSTGTHTFYFFPKNKNSIQSEGQIAVIDHLNSSNNFINAVV